jgi:hypothetical protein
MNPEDVARQVKREPLPLLSIVHQRQPSIGAVDPRNVQPFWDEKAAFCHNGTLDAELIAFLRAALNAKDWESDSLLLWHMLWKVGWHYPEPSVKVLKALSRTGNHRFVWVDAVKCHVHLIGRWAYRPDEKVWDRPLPGLDVFEYVMLDHSGQVLAAQKETRPATPAWPSWLPKRAWEM